MTDPASRGQPVHRRRRSITQAVLVVVVLSATVGILRIVVQSNILLGQMTTDVATAQGRATNLANTQREALQLLQRITALERGDQAGVDDIDVRRRLLGRQMGITTEGFPTDSSQRTELAQAQAGLAGFPWSELADPERAVVLRATAMALVSQIEIRIKGLWDEQEKYFYQATLQSLEAKNASERALIGLVSLVVVLGVCWVVLLKRRTRSDLSNAYDALVGEMSERQLAEDALRISEVRFRSLVQRASDLTAVTDLAGIVGYLSPAAEGILGVRPEDLLGRSLLEHVHAQDRQRAAAMLEELGREPAAVRTIELRMTAENGRVRTLEALCRNLLDDPAVAGIVWNGRDITDRRALQDQLSHQANHDGLTGLPNRALFTRRLSTALEHAVASGESVVAMLIDLDGFKNVNDTFGHAAGDELLQRVAERLRGCVLEGDTVARLGGDEFAIAIPGGTVTHASAVSRRVIAALRLPISAAGQEVRVGASIGVAELVGHRSAEELISDADIAMYAAKRNGKGRYQLFAQEMRDRTLERARMEQQLALAVPLGQIEVYFQPIVNLAACRVTGVEALARWRLADGRIVEPAVFIPIAEESGLINEIGAAVLRRACGVVQGWRETVPGAESLGVAVNVSGWQMLSANYSVQVADALAETGLPPGALTLEITESMLLEDSDALLGELGRLRGLGVRLAMDDFGAGYSSLSSLLRFEVDILKIDRMFLDVSIRTRGSLVRAVTELGHTLSLSVVAEGVETAEQLTQVRAAGCDSVQGYLISKPLPEADARLFLEWAAATDEITRLLAATPVASA